MCEAGKALPLNNVGQHLTGVLALCTRRPHIQYKTVKAEDIMVKLHASLYDYIP